MEQVNFKMIGRLTMPKENDKFKPYEERPTAKGNGKMYNLSFNCQMLNNGKPSGNQSMMKLSEYMPNDPSNKVVFAYINDGYDEATHKFKGHSEKIEWAKRLDEKLVSKVANFTKFIVDLEEPKVRIALRNIEKALNEGHQVKDKDLKDAGLDSVDKAEHAITQSKKKRKEFISKYDFILFLHRLLTDEKLQSIYGERQFLVEGTHEFNYSAQSKKWYESFSPSRIYLQPKDAVSYAHEDVEFLYGSDGLNDTLDEIGKYTVNGFVRVREQFSNKPMFAPYTLTVLKQKTGDDEKDAKADQVRMKRFTVDDEDVIKCMGVVVNVFNGTELLRITEDDLTEEQQESILMGDCTLEDIQRELGGYKRSERQLENRFFKLMNGYSKGCQDTAYTRDMMNNEEETDDSALFDDVDDIDDTTSEVETTTSDDEEDIFDDFDDLL